MGYSFGPKPAELTFGSQVAKVTQWADTWVSAVVPRGRSGATPVRPTHADGAKRSGGMLFGGVPAKAYPRRTTTGSTVTVPRLPAGSTTVSVRTKGGDSETLAFRVR